MGSLAEKKTGSWWSRQLESLRRKLRMRATLVNIGASAVTPLEKHNILLQPILFFFLSHIPASFRLLPFRWLSIIKGESPTDEAARPFFSCCIGMQRRSRHRNSRRCQRQHKDAQRRWLRDVVVFHSLSHDDGATAVVDIDRMLPV